MESRSGNVSRLMIESFTVGRWETNLSWLNRQVPISGQSFLGGWVQRKYYLWNNINHDIITLIPKLTHMRWMIYDVLLFVQPQPWLGGPQYWKRADPQKLYNNSHYGIKIEPARFETSGEHTSWGKVNRFLVSPPAVPFHPVQNGLAVRRNRKLAAPLHLQ